MAEDLITERLLRVIDEGRRTATYKLALLLALMDCVAANPGKELISTRSIAAHVLGLYYPQSREYVATGGVERELRQMSREGSPVVRVALKLRVLGESTGCRSVLEVRASHPDDYEAALDEIEHTFVRYPIDLLQVVGGKAVPFLYEQDLHSVDGQRHVQLLPGVGDRLVGLGPLLRPLIEMHWISDVAKWSNLDTEDERLRAHLFGTARIAFPPALREGLGDIQHNDCFYCGDRLAKKNEVDHFLAWSRWPNNAIENLVLADKCNGAKSDHLAASEHLACWTVRASKHRDALAEVAELSRWETDPARARGLLASTYSRVAEGTPLWLRGKDFEYATGPIEFG